VFVDLLANGDPHWSITLPPLIGASYDRGNWLATHRESLGIVDCYEQDKALKLAEICTIPFWMKNYPRLLPFLPEIGLKAMPNRVEIDRKSACCAYFCGNK
jgi:hypothetical protein